MKPVETETKQTTVNGHSILKAVNSTKTTHSNPMMDVIDDCDGWVSRDWMLFKAESLKRMVQGVPQP